MKYKRKPMPVDAVLWDGSEGAREELEKMLGGPSQIHEKGVVSVAGMIIPFGIWVVKKPDDKVMAYTPKDFETRFEPVEADVSA